MVTIGNPTTLGHHEMEAAEIEDPSRRPKTAELDIEGATAAKIDAFKSMQDQARVAETADVAPRGRVARIRRFLGRRR